MFDNILKTLFGGGNRSSNNQQNNNMGFRPRNRNMFVYKLVTFEQARNMIERNEVVLIDVRTASEYELMHIVNAINIPVEDIDKQIFVYEQTKPIMVYCSSGTRSKTAIQILNSFGYNNIYIWEYGALATFPYKNMLEYGENIKREI